MQLLVHTNRSDKVMDLCHGLRVTGTNVSVTHAHTHTHTILIANDYPANCVNGTINMAF